MDPETRDIFLRLLDGKPLAEPAAESLFSAVLSGVLAECDIAAILLAIACRGATVDELVGAARALRRCATRIPLPPTTLPILDTCGTGGAPKLFNVSTLGAIVTAAAADGRVLVAKHGNRSRTGRGSAELLESLGVNIHASPATQAECLRQIGLCFSYAPDHHPAARHAATVRKKLGVPTIFNLVGPLVNPAGATCQIVGTYSIENAEKLAAAFSRLGTARVLVVMSRDGLDELTTTAVNELFTVTGDSVCRTALDATSFGFAPSAIPQLQASSLDDAVAMARSILAGEPGPRSDLVTLNAAASLFVAGTVPSIADGVAPARAAIASGRAAHTLQRLTELTAAG